LTDQVYNNIQKYGNTTAASIPIALTEAWENGKIKTGDTVGCFWKWFYMGKCYHKMVSNFLMSIESSYEYKT
jgi:hypothetical protein